MGDCAAELLEVVPLIMRVLRSEVRRRRTPELSVAQFRALAFVGRNAGAKLSELAGFLGLTAPSASKLVDGLVAARLLAREVPVGNRRRIALALSPAGRREYDAVLKHARAYLGSRLSHLSHSRRERVALALRDLRLAFESEEPAESTANGAAVASTITAPRSRRLNLR